MDYTNLTTGERIKTLRQMRGLTATQLGKAIGKNHITIYRYENGIIKKIPYGILIKIADVLETTPAFLNDEVFSASDNSNDDPEMVDKFKKISNDLFQDGSDISIECLWQLTDKEKQIIKRVVQYSGELSDKEYDCLNKILDAFIELRK